MQEGGKGEKLMVYFCRPRTAHPKEGKTALILATVVAVYLLVNGAAKVNLMFEHRDAASKPHSTIDR